MKLLSLLTICLLSMNAESQSASNKKVYVQRSMDLSDLYVPIIKPQRNSYNEGDDIQVNVNKQKQDNYDSYLQAATQQSAQGLSQNVGDGVIYFDQPNTDLSPPYYDTNSYKYYAVQPLSNSDISGTQNRIQGRTDKNDHLNNVTRAITNLGINLLKSAKQQQSGNVILSPTSIATLLALLQQGSYGTAQEQITAALQMTPDITPETYRRLTIDMRKRNSRNILTVANNVLVADAFDINKDFKTTAVRNFGSEITPMNFANNHEAVKQINAWVASQTHNKINNLLTPDAVGPNTQLVLVNAVYFKGLWETKFKPEATLPREFTTSSGEKKMIPFMRMRNPFKFGVDRTINSRVTILPFERDQYTMILILPNVGTEVDNVVNSLSDEKLINYHSFETTEVQLEIPRFTIKSDTDLNPVLMALGITNIFGSRSDLAGLGLYRTFPPQISTAVHTGYLSVDEQGVSAAAATAFAAVALSFDDSVPPFVANRPFIAVLWDTQLAIPLFMAKIEDPSS